jgi:hypothetical protein
MAHPSKYHQHRRQNALHKAMPSHCAVNTTYNHINPTASTTQRAAYAAITASTSLPLVLPGWVLHPPPLAAAAGQLSQAVAACLVRRVRHQKPLRMVGLAGESNSTAPDSNKAAPQQRPPPNALLVQPLLPQQASRWCCLGGSCTPRRLLLLLGSCPKLWLHAWCGGCATRSCCTW